MKHEKHRFVNQKGCLTDVFSFLCVLYLDKPLRKS